MAGGEIVEILATPKAAGIPFPDVPMETFEGCY
jgi:hypothetical protein